MRVIYAPGFVRKFKKLSKDLQEETSEKIELFKEDPTNKQLKTHKLKGKFSELHSFSVNYSYRIIFKIEDDDYHFLEFGNHDMYK